VRISFVPKGVELLAKLKRETNKKAKPKITFFFIALFFRFSLYQFLCQFIVFDEN
jgi:hypothetical protein